MGTKPTKLTNRPSWPTKAANLGLFPVRAKVTEDLFQRGDLFLLSITRAHGGYTGRFVVGRGRWWSNGCGLHTYEVLWNTESKCGSAGRAAGCAIGQGGVGHTGGCNMSQ